MIKVVYYPSVGYSKDFTIDDITEIIPYRNDTIDEIHKYFKWEDYDKEYNHLLYYVEICNEEGEVDYINIYQMGRLMTELEFDNEIFNQKDLKFGYIGCLHKH